MNVAIVCRESGLLALDVDKRHGGPATLHDLEGELGKLPNTPRTVTGGGGAHIFFQNPRVTTGTKLGKGIDIRDRAYVIVPPSEHQSGRAYTWEIAPTEAPLAQLPAPWLARLTRRKYRPPQPGGPDGGAPIREGERHDALVDIAVSLRHAGLSTGEIGAALDISNLERCSPPLPAEEVAGIAGWAGGLTLSPWRHDLLGWVCAAGTEPLSAGEKLVLAWLGRRADQDGIAIGGEWLGEATSLSRNSVHAHARALEAKGRLRIIRRRDPATRRNLANRYELFPFETP